MGGKPSVTKESDLCSFICSSVLNISFVRFPFLNLYISLTLLVANFMHIYQYLHIFPYSYMFHVSHVSYSTCLSPRRRLFALSISYYLYLSFSILLEVLHLDTSLLYISLTLSISLILHFPLSRNLSLLVSYSLHNTHQPLLSDLPSMSHNLPIALNRSLTFSAFHYPYLFPRHQFFSISFALTMPDSAFFRISLSLDVSHSPWLSR